MWWFISQSLVFIILAFILGVIAGRLWKKAPEKPAEPPVTDDELERIEGVGPAMANALRSAGIRTYAQLAETDDETKRNALKTAGLNFAPSLATWSRQARLLADGDEAAFAILTARLIAGRDTDQPAPRPAPKPTPRPAATEPPVTNAPVRAVDPTSFSAIPVPGPAPEPAAPAPTLDPAPTVDPAPAHSPEPTPNPEPALGPAPAESAPGVDAEPAPAPAKQDPKKAERKKSESKKNGSRKGERNKPGRENEGANR